MRAARLLIATTNQLKVPKIIIPDKDESRSSKSVLAKGKEATAATNRLSIAIPGTKMRIHAAITRMV
jgi:hypothetical protein